MIRILSEKIIDRIAAGEVVERPAAVVKELVENALDAGAEKVEVHLEAGGRRMIKVIDNGEGISPDDLKLAFHRHATSKLQQLEDLEHIASLGFRGEALASIGAVSRCRITSRRADSDGGAVVENQGGTVTGPRPAGCPPGTTVEVKNLFYNVKPRLKFLKTESTELSHCVACMTRFALAHPEVEFRVHHNGRTVFHVESKGNMRDRIAGFYGDDTAEKLIPLDKEMLGIRIKGFLGRPALGRRDTRRCFLFLNGRYIKDKAVHAALCRSFREVMPAKLHPVYFLEISMPPEWVDVNVHPTKTEVRFLDGARVFTALLKVTSEALAGGASFTAAMAPSSGALPFRRSDSFDRHRYARSDAGSGTVSDAGAEIERADSGLASWTGAPAGRSEPFPSGYSAQLIKGTGAFVPEKILQVHETYAVFETPEGLALVDQHALHERVLYESLRAEFEGGGIRLQRLLLPITIDLEPGLAARMESICVTMNRLGIDAEPFGRKSLRVSAVPALLRNADPRSMVIDVIDRLARDEEGDEAYRGILFRMACRAAVKAGHRLSAEELKALMKSAEGIDFTGHCPHGRPTTVSFSLADIEKLFKRRGF